jgi:ABC-2 type transport system ATP-binding protein
LPRRAGRLKSFGLSMDAPLDATGPGTAAAIPGIFCRGLGKAFGTKWAVHDLNLSIQPGEFFGFLGPNGAGKSTTIKMLTSLLLPTQGEIYVAGVDVRRDPLRVKSLIGVLPEDINTYERLTGWELLLFTGRMYGLSRAEAASRSAELLTLMEIAEDDRHRLVVDYSMGMKKKVVLACALIHGPKVLFLDEPFNGIDARTGVAIRHVLRTLTERGTTIFFSSHILEVVEKLCTRIGIIDKGMLVAQGTLDELRALPAFTPETSLEEIFLHYVGAGGGKGSISWLGSSSS